MDDATYTIKSLLVLHPVLFVWICEEIPRTGQSDMKFHMGSQFGSIILNSSA